VFPSSRCGPLAIYREVVASVRVATARGTAGPSSGLGADGERAEAQAGIAVRAIAAGSVHRTVFAATRFADAKRPSVKALLAAVRAAAARLGRPAPGQAAA
jgi:hypothetical protein